MFWVYILQNPNGHFTSATRTISQIELQVIIEPTRSAENLRGKTDRGLWCGLKNIQIAQAQCDASAKLRTGNLHV